MASSMQIDGMVSGLDTAGMISAMMAVEKQPLVALQTQQTKLRTHSSALSSVAAKLSSLRSAVDALGRVSTFNARKVSTDTASGVTAAVSATANADAAVGSFKLTINKLATSTRVAGATDLGQPIDSAASLSKAGFAVTPTDGYFTVNGVRIDVDADTTKLSDVVGAINDPAKATGVTASVENNRLILRSDSAIRLGTGADTSNFLTAAKILAAPDGGASVGGGTTYAHTVGSTGNLGVAQMSASLADARLTTPLNAATGKFSINGVEISYDSANDSLSRVISRINASAAGVTASYDSQTDRISLASKATGSLAVDVKDVAGNFLTAVGLTGGQTLGRNAEYSIDTVNGGQTLYSASNTISGVVPGVTLNLKATTPTNSPVTVNVEQDSTNLTSAIKTFVDSYNSAVSYIQSQTKWDSTTKTGGPLLGSSEVTSIESRLRTLVAGMVSGTSGKYTNLASIGVSTGAVGSGVGSANTLQLDESKLAAALADNPAAVSRLFVPPEPVVSSEDGGTGNLASVNRSPSSNPRTGKYVITSKADGSLSSVFTPTGGVAQSAVTGTIAAGGTNSTLISGLVLHGKDVLVDGTDTVIVKPGDSVAGRLGSFLDSLISSTGSLTSSGKSDTEEISRIDKRLIDMQSRLDDKQTRIQARFTALEAALAQLQSQTSNLSSIITGLNSSSSSNG